MKKYILLILFTIPFLQSFSQAVGNPLRWQRSFGGSQSDVAYSICQTNDGGYIVAGSTFSNDFDVTFNYGSQDFWVVKLNNFGVKQWEKSFGGSGNDVAKSVIQTSDLGFLVVGYTNSIDGNISQFYGNTDYWVLKLSAAGTLQWQHSYGGSDIDEANEVIQTSDGGYLVAGKSYSADNGIIDHKGMFDAWLVKINASGVEEWSKSYGGSLLDEAKSVIQTSDLGYLVACSSNSIDLDVALNKGAEDYWLIKLSNTGTIIWQKSLGGTSSDIPSRIIKTNDNCFFIQGSSSSNDGDVTGNHLSQDFWGVKINPTGNIIWQRSLGGSDVETGTSVIQIPDSSYILCGHTKSFDGDVSMNHGMWDSWVVKLDKFGSTVWTKSLGGSNYDYTYAITSGNFASTVIAGSSSSSDGNVIFNNGLDDYWVADVKNLAASFSADTDTICARQTVFFTNNTLNATNYKWKINDVVFDNQFNTFYTFDSPGLFDIKLIASNALSIDSTDIQILVQSLPDISLGNDTALCPDASITLDPGFNIDYNYFWSTGASTPTITIASTGVYMVTASDVFTGCVRSDTIWVAAGVAVSFDLGPDQTSCAGNTVTLDPGSFTGCSYSWSTGANTQTINVTATGDYSVTVTNSSSGCFDRDTVHVTFNPIPIVDLGTNQNVCIGTAVTLDAANSPGSTYSWSSGQATQTIQPATTGDYSVTVANSFGCTDRDTVHITFNSLPSVNIGSNQTTCYGNIITLDAGLLPGGSYNWSSGQNTQTIQPTATGDYSVTVTNSFGCTDRDTVHITFNPKPIVNLGADQSVCIGTTVTLDAANSPGSTYNWSSGQSTQTIQPSATGDYSVTVTNSFGCTDRDTVYVTFKPLPSVNLGSDQTMCSGIIVTLDAGLLPGGSYNWSSGQNTQTIQPTATGDYSVTVTNSFGCTDRDTVHITFNPKPIVNLGADQSVCIGTTVTLDAANSPGSTYSWSSGQVTQTIQPAATGDYSVTVTNSFSCTDRDTIHVTINTLPYVNLGSDFNLCSGNSNTLDAGYETGASYLWSTSGTTQTITITTGGTYSVTMTNAAGCIDIDSIVITDVASPVVNLGNDQTVCSGNTVILDAQNAGSNYLWSTGEYSQTISVTLSGPIYVTVTNPASGCSDSDTVNITIITTPVVDLGDDQAICSGDTAWLTAPYVAGATYSWSTGSGNQSIGATISADYSVTVTTTGGCSDADTVNILFNTPPSINLGTDITSCLGDTVTIGATCAGCSYNWQPGPEITSNIDVFSTGTYILNVNDANGCTDADTVEIIFNLSPKIILDSIKHVSCYSLNDGAIYISIINGTPPFSYQWSTSSVDEDYLNLQQGPYTVTVSDSNGCTDTATFIVTEPSQLIIDSVVVTNTSCSYTTDGSIQIFASGGAGTFVYSVDGGSTFQSAPLFQNLAQNTYNIILKDMNGCSVSLNNITIISNSNLAVFIGNDTTICNGSSITLDAGNPGALYSWYPLGQTSQTIFAAAGTYSVSVYQGGCTATDTIVIGEYSSVSVVIDSTDDVSCFGSGDGAIYTTVTGGIPSYNYSWSPNSGTASGNDYFNLSAGSYTVTVTDSMGCIATQSAVVSSPAALTIITDNVQGTTCNGLANGAINITPAGGTSPYIFVWSSGESLEDLVNIPAGNYSVTISDMNNCTASESFIIDSPSELIATLDSVTDAIVCGSATGAVYITASGGTSPYTYLWNDNSASEDNINVTPGYYVVTVTDNNGCSANLSATVYDNYCQVYVASGTTTESICDSINYVEVGPMVILEYADTSSGFIKSQNNVHLILDAPDNFEFEAGVGNIYYGNGNNDIISASIIIDPQFIDITFSTGNSYSHLDTLAITGIRVKAISNVIFSPNEILMDASSTAAINGISLSTVFGTLHQSTLMTITNITTFHTDSTVIIQGSFSNCVAGIKITTSGNCGTPMLVQEFELSTATSDNPYNNISEARIFYTGHSPYFGAVDVQGTYIYPDGNFNIVAATPLELLEGDNYFWLAYDVYNNANIGDSLEGKCIKAIIDGNYYYATALPPISIKRMVDSLGSFVSHHSGTWDEAWSWGGSKEDKATWSPDENDDVTINNGDTITLTSNGSCANLTINDGLLILDSYQLTVSGNLTGNEKDSIRSTSSSSLVINDLGDKDQFPIPSAMKKLKKLTLNRASGASCNHDLDLDDAVPSDSIVLVLSNGAFELSSGKKLLMNSKAIQLNISSSNSTYVNGIVSRNIKRDVGFYIYPLGDEGECRPFGIACQSGNGDNINEVQFFYTTPINFAYIDYHFLPGGITDKMYWRHDKISGGNTARRIYYHDDDFPGLSAVQRDSALCLANNSGVTESEWTKETTPYDVYDDASKKYVEFTSANASNDPYWTFGSVVESSPLVEDLLPIELLSFDAALNDELSVEIVWTTVSESNNDFFTIERAGPDLQFTPLFIVNGAGNNYSLLAYHALDEDPLEGTSYYRLKQTDFDGEFTYSSIRMVVYDADNPVLVYPNPASTEFSIQIFAQVPDDVTITLYDDKGLKVYEKETSIEKGTNEVSIDIQNLNHAVYMLRIDFENNTIKPYRTKISRI